MIDLVNVLAPLLGKGMGIRQAEVTAVTVTTSPGIVSVKFGTTVIPGIVCMDHLIPRVGDGVWIADLGAGRWICIGISGKSFAPRNLSYGASFDTPTVAAANLVVGSQVVDIAAGRRIRITAAMDLGWFGTVAADTFSLDFRVNGATIFTGAPVYVYVAGAYIPMGSLVFQTTAITAGSKTIDLQVHRTAGTGVLQVRGKVYVDDMGPA